MKLVSAASALLLLAFGCSSAAAAPEPQDADSFLASVAPRYIVYPKKGASIAAISSFFDTEQHITFRHDLPSIGAKAIDVTDISILDAIAGHPDIAYIEKDVPRQLFSSSSSSSSSSLSVEESAMSALRGLQSAPTYGLKLIGADVTPFKSGVTGSQLAVCIIDSGVNAAHPGLSGVSIGAGNSGATTDTCGHGTHVTGTVAGPRTIGVASGVRVYAVKVFNGASCAWSFSSDLIAATDLCKSAAGSSKLVISMSLGGSQSSTAESSAFTNLNAAGVLSIAAAGNSGNTAFSYPASYASVVSVAAVDSAKRVASFSQKNSQVDIAAPGVGVYSTYLNNGYSNLSGTSMATPHVSGAAAVVWSYGLAKGWTNENVRNALLSTATDLGTAGRDNSYGNGLLNVCKAAKLAGFDPSNSVSCPQ